MAEKSKIQWTDDTWNRWFGCVKISSGCLNCYIARTPPARMNGWKFNRRGVGGRTPIVMAEERRLYYPLRKTKPRMIFVNSLSDLWLAGIHLDVVAEMFAVMLLCQQHIFQVFTKRARRQRVILSDPRFVQMVRYALERVIERSPNHGGPKVRPAAAAAARAHLDRSGPDEALVPLPNLWLGATVEEERTTSRITDLQRTPAAVRMLSCEPITGHFRLTGRLDGIDLVILGGESGPETTDGPDDIEGLTPPPGLRTLDLEHLAALIGDSRTAGAATFVKQLGTPWARSVGAAHSKGGNPDEWPEHLRVREFPLQAQLMLAAR